MKNLKRLLLLNLLLLMFCASGIYAQNTVSGRVTDNNDNPLPGVTVVIKGTNEGSITDGDGIYSLKLTPEANSLVFSFVGMKTQEVALDGQTTINVELETTSIGLDEVVAVGYGSVKRSSLTGSVSKLQNENMGEIPVGNAEQALIGQLAGLSIRQTNAKPGESPQMNIRGVSSITGSNDPLVVVDGFPVGGMGDINTGDIESIEVLKDASSAAIYGSRAAGGVIIVTTKKGENKKPAFSLSSYYGIQRPTNLYDDILTSEEAYQYSLKENNVAWIQDGGDPNIPVSDRPENYRPDKEKRDFADTDWQDEVLETGIIQKHELSARGGNEMLDYYISGSYLNEEGVFIVGDYKKYSVRANLSTNFSDRLELGANIFGSKSDQRRNGMRMREAIKYPPYIPVYLYDGETAPDGSRYAWNRYYFSGGTSQVNPVAKSVGDYINYERFTAQANSYLKYSIVEGLDLKVSLGVRYNNTKNPSFRTTYAHKNRQVSADFDYWDNINVLNENILTYQKTFADVHAFNALIGASYQKQNNFSSSIEVVDGSIPDNRIQTLNVGIVSEGSTFKSEWGLISYFGRLNYAFADKYLVSAAYRTDGSSRFGADTKWGYFPSLSFGWRVDQEDFLSSYSAITTLKPRVSYGLTGRTTSGLYEPLARVQNYPYSLGPGNGTVVSGATQGTFGNSELSWEKTKEYNIGLDFGIFDNRILIIADAYKRNTTDLLLDNPIPAVTGFNSTTTNVGQLSNKGIELFLHTRNLTGQLQWDTKLNYSRNINTVEDLGGLEQLPLSKASKGMWFQTKVGEPIGQFYGWHQQGIWKNQEEIDANPSYPGAKPGSIRVADLNNDGEIDTDDRAVLGSYMPDFTFGLINEFRYKNLDLSIHINGVIGAEIYNFEFDYYRSTRKIWTENQWFSPDDPGDGKTFGSTSGVNRGATDFFIQDGSYWGARNITLGYTLSKNSALSRVFNSARLYVSVQNAFMVTGEDFTGYNPEGYTDDSGSLTTRGVNYGSEPLNRTFTIGVNLNF